MNEIKLTIANRGDVKTIVESLRATHVEWLAKELEEQVKPAIEEPLQFASVVRDAKDRRWVRIGAVESLPWASGAALRQWGQLDVAEVLRVGIGESDEDAEGEAFTAGVRHTIARGTRVLEGFRDQAITAERQDAYQNAINVLRELS